VKRRMTTTEHAPAPSEDTTHERGPVRTCVGCRTRAPKEELLRLVPAPDGAPGPELVVDLLGKLPGRGISLHPRRPCLEAAVKRGGIAHALRRAPRSDASSLARAIADRLSQRALAIVTAARGARAVVLGTEAVREALAGGDLALLLVASDAEGRRDELIAQTQRAGREAIVLTTGETQTKAELGKMFGRDELAVIGVTDPRIAEQVTQALTTALDLLAPTRTEAR
jgi:predicted RNA-binding protein YlxR (DUF448 family)